MKQHTRDRRAPVGRLALVLCLLAAALVAFHTEAATRAELYQATVPVADRSEAAQSAAFEAAMRVVLVRVTGRRAAGDEPALAPLVDGARRYVQQYRSAGEGLLWVAFDGAAIERWLTQNGQPLWGHTRPATVVFIAVAGAGAGGSVLTHEDSSELKAAIDAAAAARGAPLIWPSAADLKREQLDYTSISSASASSLAEAAHRLGGEGVLVGRASGAGAGANVRWTFAFQERASEFTGEPAEGPNRAADTYVGIFGVSGAVVPVEVEVAGIRELKDYGEVQTYLESLALVTHVAVEGLTGDTVRFTLTARGGAEALGHVLALDGRLHANGAGENGILRFQLHQ